MGVTPPSSWPWVDHPVSGLHPATETPYSDSLSLRLPYTVRLATECKSLTHYTKGMPSLLAELRPLVCMRFQDLFHSPPGVLFAFPSRYWFTIGRLRVFSLGGWSPHVQTGFHVPRPTQFHLHSPFAYRAVTFYGRPFQTALLELHRLLGCSPFARHYSGNLG